MIIPCWIPKATNTHSQYVTLIAFPLQQWLNEPALMLRYTQIACLVLLRCNEVTFLFFNEDITKCLDAYCNTKLCVSTTVFITQGVM